MRRSSFYGGRCTPSVYSRFGSKLPLPLSADVRLCIPMTHHILKVLSKTCTSARIPSGYVKSKNGLRGAPRTRTSTFGICNLTETLFILLSAAHPSSSHGTARRRQALTSVNKTNGEPFRGRISLPGTMVIGIARLGLPAGYTGCDFSAVQDVDQATVQVNLTKAGQPSVVLKIWVSPLAPVFWVEADTSTGAVVELSLNTTVQNHFWEREVQDLEFLNSIYCYFFYANSRALLRSDLCGGHQMSFFPQHYPLKVAAHFHQLMAPLPLLFLLYDVGNRPTVTTPPSRSLPLQSVAAPVLVLVPGKLS